MSIDILEKPVAKEKPSLVKFQWRGSLDGLLWCEWRDLVDFTIIHRASDPHFKFAQARKLVDGFEAARSPIYTWGCFWDVVA